MKKIITLLFLFVSAYSFACQCPVLAPVSKELAAGYDVVFSGKIDSVGACSTKGIATVYFTISELYKGTTEKHLNAAFDCASECLMSFAQGEEWLIYSKYEKFDLLKIDICGHSRKNFNDDAKDIYLIAAQRSFLQEKEFLKTTFGLQYFIEANDLNKQHEEVGPHNDQPSGMGKITLLLISFAVMGIVYFVTRKKK
jgi:hypothetical protein